jgi:hypothetical protein
MGWWVVHRHTVKNMIRSLALFHGPGNIGRCTKGHDLKDERYRRALYGRHHMGLRADISVCHRTIVGKSVGWRGSPFWGWGVQKMHSE